MDIKNERPIPSTLNESELELTNLDKTLRREIYLAREIQTKLLNAAPPAITFGEVIGTSLPARLIGGDYYDFYPLLNGNIRIVIGDVMGKGIPAAMLMILTRGAFRSAAESTKGPGETLTAMNNALWQDLRALKSFVTLCCADWDPESRTLTYANAGHHLPLHIDCSTGAVEPVDRVQGIMVGGLPNQVYEEKKVKIGEDDVVFFYTDGIIEAQNKNGDFFHLDRLKNILKESVEMGAGEIKNHVMGYINEFTTDIPQKDDITMVVLKISGDKSDISSLNVPHINS